tara:strand:- start:242 stop:1363 length:1122 start_codon:yes stop_codon:yes gene_type:complete
MKNKIHKYDFLVVGAGLIGSLTALNLCKKNFSVLVVDKNIELPKDDRTLAVNANSKDFLKNIGLWDKLKTKPSPIEKIIIKDNINSSPLIFENSYEEMGNVVFNKELLSKARNILEQKKILIGGLNIDIFNILPKKNILIKGKNYFFNNIILSLGKKYQEIENIEKYSFSNDHSSFVGFFNHRINHDQIAYEVFTPEGPLAVLPAPDKSKKKSTFIYSSKINISENKIHNLLKKHFCKTHGSIKLSSKISKFKIIPHLSKDKSNNYILIGDTLRSIHPVAGQGWNLGIKDIQHLDGILERYDANNPNLLKRYYDQRNIENISYLSFTSLLNFLYENQNSLTKLIIKIGFNSLRNFSFLRNVFIKQAMGRFKLI